MQTGAKQLLCTWHYARVNAGGVCYISAAHLSRDAPVNNAISTAKCGGGGGGGGRDSTLAGRLCFFCGCTRDLRAQQVYIYVRRARARTRGVELRAGGAFYD